jgi:hypothetical protein
MILRVTAESSMIRILSLRNLRSWWSERVQIQWQSRSRESRRPLPFEPALPVLRMNRSSERFTNSKTTAKTKAHWQDCSPAAGRPMLRPRQRRLGLVHRDYRRAGGR